MVVRVGPAGAGLRAPLSDITVLDLTTALAGPYATLLLAGLGARVIKIENPAGGDSCRHNPPYVGAGGLRLAREAPDDMSVSSLNRLRNKLGVTLNLKHPGARHASWTWRGTPTSWWRTSAAAYWTGWASATRSSTK